MNVLKSIKVVFLLSAIFLFLNNDCLAIEKSDAKKYNSLGIKYGKQGKYIEAERYLLKAIEINPDYYEAIHNLGYLYEIQKKYKEAIYYYEKRLRLKPDTDEKLHLLELYLKTEKYGTVIHLANEILDKNPDNEKAREFRRIASAKIDSQRALESRKKRKQQYLRQKELEKPNPKLGFWLGYSYQDISSSPILNFYGYSIDLFFELEPFIIIFGFENSVFEPKDFLFPKYLYYQNLSFTLMPGFVIRLAKPLFLFLTFGGGLTINQYVEDRKWVVKYLGYSLVFSFGLKLDTGKGWGIFLNTRSINEYFKSTSTYQRMEIRAGFIFYYKFKRKRVIPY